MKTISVIVLFLIIFVPIYECAVAISLNTEHKDYPGKCYVKLSNGQPLLISPGNSKKNPVACLRYYCSEIGFTLQYATCGVLAPEKHCWEVAGDPSKPYPGCCNEYIC